MASSSDIVLFAGMLIASLGLVISTGVIELEGTQATNLICSIPVVSDGYSACDTSVSQKYDLTTEISVGATEQTAFLSEQSFDYTTTKSGFSSFSLIGPSNLAFGGANNVEVNFNLVNSEGKLIADGNKYVGEIGILQQEKVLFNVNNLPRGQYSVEYELVYDPGFGGATQTETLEKSVRIPKRMN